MRGFHLFLKRFGDIFVSALMIILLSPLMLVLSLAIVLSSKGPAVFTQERVGKGGKVFKIYKFRTMRIASQRVRPDGSVMTPKESITKVGKFLRKTSLDELMQLFNVLFGTMSIVGPRPTLPAQVEKYNEYQKQRHNMRPGVTGWAQVNGRNNLTWAQKIDYDIEYINKFNIGFDIKILFKTVGVVLKRKGIAYQDGDKSYDSTSSQAPTAIDEQPSPKEGVPVEAVEQTQAASEVAKGGKV